MIYSLNGTLLEKSTDLAVIECGGVGYAFSCSNNTLSMLPAAGSSNSCIELTLAELEQCARSDKWVDVCKGWAE